MNKNRITNENFFDEYKYFDFILSKHFKIEENGVGEYVKRMKLAVIDVRDVLPEWDATIERLNKIKARYEGLNNAETSFDEFQGKDEDVVWMRIFLTRFDSKADPLSKYSKLEFTYKKRNKSLLQKILDIFK
ncbi:MAG: hypothetical protein K5883_08520 [Pseudobutyrivibrio sp.]|nr:hypothetical protein [Pseudobutyrivibrio sp.]